MYEKSNEELHHMSFSNSSWFCPSCRLLLLARMTPLPTGTWRWFAGFTTTGRGHLAGTVVVSLAPEPKTPVSCLCVRLPEEKRTSEVAQLVCTSIPLTRDEKKHCTLDGNRTGLFGTRLARTFERKGAATQATVFCIYLMPCGCDSFCVLPLKTTYHRS